MKSRTRRKEGKESDSPAPSDCCVCGLHDFCLTHRESAIGTRDGFRYCSSSPKRRSRKGSAKSG